MKVFDGSEAFPGVLDPVFLGSFFAITRSRFFTKSGEHLPEILDL